MRPSRQISKLRRETKQIRQALSQFQLHQVQMEKQLAEHVEQNIALMALIERLTLVSQKSLNEEISEKRVNDKLDKLKYNLCNKIDHVRECLSEQMKESMNEIDKEMLETKKEHIVRLASTFSDIEKLAAEHTRLSKQFEDFKNDMHVKLDKKSGKEYNKENINKLWTYGNEDYEWTEENLDILFAN
uniref:Uncharacterized protein n=1 Tax=Ditylenchus dipsaci TaxID=166011 RepID=A0A915EMR4_9BILA